MRFGGSHRVPESACLNCGMKLDATTAVLEYGFDATPDPGDLAVCICCGHLMAYANDLSLRELTDDEVRETAGSGALIAIQRARAQMKK